MLLKTIQNSMKTILENKKFFYKLGYYTFIYIFILYAQKKRKR